MKCEKCGAEMLYYQQYSEQGWKCPNCEWETVTTYIEPIYEDTTNYCIKLNKHDIITKKQLKIVAYIKQCNYIQAKKYLVTGDSIFEEDKASKIRDIARKLKEANVDFEISPEFKYPY